MLMVRALILLYVPPKNLTSLKGGVGQNGAHDAQFSATRSFHVASRAFCGWIFCPQCPADAHDARPYSCLRYPPQQPNIRSLDFGKGVLGKTVLMMLFGGGGLGHWKSSPVVGISCQNASPEAERPRRRNGGPMKPGRRHGRSPHRS